MTANLPKATDFDNDELFDVGLDTAPIPPRTIQERIQLAIHWTLAHQRTAKDYDALPADFIQQLANVGLKLVWEDGSNIQLVPYPDGSLPRARHRVVR